MRKKMYLLAIMCFISGCSAKQLYSGLASHQCLENEKLVPDGDMARCPTEDEIDGMTYEEYEREREQ